LYNGLTANKRLTLRS